MEIAENDPLIVETGGVERGTPSNVLVRRARGEGRSTGDVSDMAESPVTIMGKPLVGEKGGCVRGSPLEGGIIRTDVIETENWGNGMESLLD
eukprot:g45537.t1